MCQTCLDKAAQRDKEHRLYAVPIEYAEREIQGNEHGIPVVVSRKLNRPRRCRSHRVKVAYRVMGKVFSSSK